MEFRAVKQPEQRIALTGCVAISNAKYSSNTAFKVRKDNKTYYFTGMPSSVQHNEMGFSGVQREFLGLAEVDSVTAEEISASKLAQVYSITLEIDFYSRTVTKQSFNADDFADAIKNSFSGVLLQVGHSFPFKHNQSPFFRLTVKEIKTLTADKGYKSSNDKPGLLNQNSSIKFQRKADSTLILTGSAVSASANIINPDFDFSKVGIGGLDDEFKEIFRRAFASRIFPPDIVEKMGGKHVRGILLYGPPGCGKTLMARKIGKMLSAREPKIVNGPEILNKYVGESEANIRKLFAEAEEEEQRLGPNSGLHIIIFDELDAICKQRGNSASSSGVHDTVVNQLLSKIDGVNSLNNVLIIGMTNRPDLIDDALKRPGRLEVHKEIGLPDEGGRKQILDIHTEKMRTNRLMAPDVDLDLLAAKTKNFSGAEIEGLVRAAQSCAFNRCTSGGTKAEMDDEKIKNVRVDMNDFNYAFQNDIKPAFGVKDQVLQQFLANGIVNWGHTDRLLSDGMDLANTAKNGKRTHLVTALLEGATGAGKSALAAKIAMDAECPCVRLINPQSLIDHGEAGKCQAIVRAFEEAHKSSQSVVVVDDIERLLDYNPIGPRFSNAVCQTLLVQLRVNPPKGRRCLVLATSSNKEVLHNMGLLGCFDKMLHVPTMRSSSHVAQALQGLGGVSERDISQISTDIGSRELSLPIKRLIHVAGVAETTCGSKGFANKFISLLEEDDSLAGAGSNFSRSNF